MVPWCERQWSPWDGPWGCGFRRSRSDKANGRDGMLGGDGELAQVVSVGREWSQYASPIVLKQVVKMKQVKWKAKGAVNRGSTSLNEVVVGPDRNCEL